MKDMRLKFSVRKPRPRAGVVEPLKPVPGNGAAGKTEAAAKQPPKELGGPSGPEPTRYGDWERKGICIDF